MALTSTFGLCPQRLAKLLNAGAGDEPARRQPSASQAAAELLRQRLTGPLHFDKGCIDSLPAILDRPCPELQPIAGRPLGEVLGDPNTPLEILETLKLYGKGLSCQWEEGSEHVVAVAIYFAAISAALVSHGRKITTRSHRELADSLRMLMGNRWITPQLTKLFDSARTICKSEEE